MTSPPLHLTEKEKRMVMDQVAMANFPSPYRERDHLTEKERGMVMDHAAMANFPSPCRESEGSEG